MPELVPRSPSATRNLVKFFIYYSNNYVLKWMVMDEPLPVGWLTCLNVPIINISGVD